MATEGKETAYQEGNLQLERVNELQRQVNRLNLDLAGFDEELERYNYLIKFDCLDTLFSEVSSSCNSKEKLSANKFIKAIKSFLKTNNPHRMKKILDGWGVLKPQIFLYEKDFDLLKGVLFEYELFMKSLLHKYFRRDIDQEGGLKEW